jgi:hypothetical protein
MKKITYLSLFLTALVLMSLSPVKDDKAKPKFQRIVCFKFKPGISAEAKTQHMNGFASFVKEVPQVLSYRAGKTVKGESKTEPEYDVMHYLTFEKEQDILQYDVTPAHKKFVDANKNNWEKVIALNGGIEK